MVEELPSHLFEHDTYSRGFKSALRTSNAVGVCEEKDSDGSRTAQYAACCCLLLLLLAAAACAADR